MFKLANQGSTHGTAPQAEQRGLLIVLSGPAGVGKDTLMEHWQMAAPTLRRVVTYTTRPQAEGERQGVDYFFVTEEEFKKLIDEGAFLEHAHVHGHWYGTPLHDMERMRDAGRDAVLIIDVQGGVQVKLKLSDAIMIFVQPPSIEELEARMRKRGRDTNENIQLRLNNAMQEMTYIPHYDYLITNDVLQRAVETLRCVLIAEKHRIR